jgi:hypothetical protein
MSLTARKTSGTTGRSGYHMVGSRPTAHGEVATFVTKLCSTNRKQGWRWLLLTNRVAKTIYREINQAVSMGIHGHYYRGRRFPIGQQPIGAADFGPPPPDKRDEERYNEKGKEVLYLCRNVSTVNAERPPTDELCLFIQAFNIQLDTVRILRLDSDLEKRFPYLQYMLLESEYAAEGTTFVRFPYRATHFIAEICRCLDIGAVEYPSVRGGYKDNHEAVNLVVFEQYCDRVCSMMTGKAFKYQLT